MTAAKDLRQEALRLPREERAGLARDLIESLDEPADDDPEQAWLDEAERRATEAALELHDAVAQLRAGNGPTATTLQLHSGIHAGLVLVIEGEGRAFLRAATEVKTIWVPYGEG